MHLSDHWLPLRRFGGSPDRWYNLNSLLRAPEWLSSEHLSLAINTAEQEGHSVFAVRKIGSSDDSGLTVLPESQADLMALQLGSPPTPASGECSFYAGCKQRIALNHLARL